MRLRHGFPALDRGQRVAFAAAGAADPARIVGQPGLPTDASLPISVDPFACFSRPEGLEASPGRAPGAISARLVPRARCEAERVDRLDGCRSRHEIVQDRVGRRNSTCPLELVERFQEIAFAPRGWVGGARNSKRRAQASTFDNFRQQSGGGERFVGLRRVGAPAGGCIHRSTGPGD
ncbi:MAG: hypothetical protein RL173_731 [Fibrobacterota bacterium]|jgi:hypothetical protein